MTDKKIRVGVIGVGSFGRLHALKYSKMEGAALVGVVDTDFDRAESVGEECDCMAFADWNALVKYCQPEAVSIATPAHFHYPLAWLMLQRNIDVFVEKPMGEHLEEAIHLNSVAQREKRILQVGFIERFNPLIRGLRHDHMEFRRVSPCSERVQDISVVMDMMIHDIDIALCLFGTGIVQIRAKGHSKITDHIDWAWAMLEFENGVEVQLIADRTAHHIERRVRVGQDESIDLNGVHDALLSELEAFVHSVRTRIQPIVKGTDGVQALKVALQIEGIINE